MNSDAIRSLIKTRKATGAIVGSFANELLTALNIPVVQTIKVTSFAEAENAAAKIGYPVVLKVDSQSILHKSEFGGVRTGIKSSHDLKVAFERMNVAFSNQGKPKVEFAVQKELHGIEVILGGKRDPTFGPMVMFGLGGVWVELLEDASIRLCPLSSERAEEMIREIKGYPLLNGYRGAAKLDTSLVSSTLQKIASALEQVPEISEFEINPFIISENPKDSAAVDARTILSENTKIEDSPLSGSAFGNLFNSSSIAVIGGSSDYAKVGGRIVQRIIRHGYKGKVAVINPKEKSTDTMSVFSSIMDVPYPVDAALMVLPSETSVQVMGDCAKKGVKFVAVYSTGFGETDSLGEDREKRLLQAAGGVVRIAGPNILGFINPRSKLFAEFTSFEGDIPEGNVGFVAQSGGMGSSLVTVGADNCLGTSALISTGNETDLDLADGIDYFTNDPETRVIVCYSENVRNGRKLKLASKNALRAKKPIIIYKAGISKLGKNLAKSHTAAVAVDDKIFDAFTRDFGVIRVREMYDSLQVAKAFSMQPLPRGNRVAIVSGSGGANVILTDVLSTNNAAVPEFSQATQDRLRSLFPDTVVRNPVDVSATVVGKPELLGSAMDTILANEEIDLVIVVVTTFSERQGGIIAEHICDKKKYGKPILVIWPFPVSAVGKQVKYLQDNSIPVYLSSESAAKSAVAMINYSKSLETLL